jgi:hypothetical protein
MDEIVMMVPAVPEGTVQMAHAPSLDCAGMVMTGTSVYCTENIGRSVKTAYTIQLCEEIREDGSYTVVG